MPTVTKIGVNTENIVNLKNSAVFSALSGNYREYKSAIKSIAAEGVKNFDAVKSAQGIKVNGSVPLFSKTGRHILKIKILESFRIKTKEEKEFAKLVKKDKLKEDFKNNLRSFFEKNIRHETDEVIKNKVEPLIKEKTDYVMKMIPEDLMNALSESVAEITGEICRKL